MPSPVAQLPLVAFVLALFFVYAWLVRSGKVAGKVIIGVGVLVSVLAVGAWVAFWVPSIRNGLPPVFLVSGVFPIALASAWSVWTAYRTQVVEDVAVHTVGDTKIIVRVCSAQKIPDADALLVPTVTSLRMVEGLAGQIGFAAGPDVQRAAREAGPVGVGKVVTTGAGRLAVARILHVAVADPLKPTDGGRLRKGMEAGAQQARKAGAESLAVPVGALRGLPLAASAEAIVSGVLRHRKAFAEVVFLVLNGRDAGEVSAAVSAALAGSGEAASAATLPGR